MFYFLPMITSCTSKNYNYRTLPWAVEFKYTAYQGGGGIYALMLSRLYNNNKARLFAVRW